MVSVIIPFHNAATFIAATAEALMRQTLDDDHIEFLFVNDASTDTSEEILQEVLYRYPERPFAILHHNHCRGLMTSRYTGLLNSLGDYIIFCDADDIPDADLYERMHREALRTDADIVVSGMLQFQDTPALRTLDAQQLLASQHQDTQHYQGGDTIPAMPTDPRILAEHVFGVKRPAVHGSLCTKLIRRTLFEGLTPDPSIRYCEDLLWLLPILFKAKKVAYTPDTVYHYRQHTGSMVATATPSSYRPTRLTLQQWASDTTLPAAQRACARAQAQRLRRLTWRRRLKRLLHL